MKQVLAGGAALALATVLVAWGCGGFGPTADCVQLCATAGACGLLPSSLGASLDGEDAVSNCAARCELTEPELRTSVTNCAPSSDAGVGWCGDYAPCVALAKCLSRGVPNAGVLGIARLDALPVAAAAYADAGCGASDPTQTCVAPLCGTDACASGAAGCDRCLCDRPLGYSPADAQGYCADLGASQATLWVEQRDATSRSGPAPCAQMLADRAVFASLTPGPTRVWIELRGQSPDHGGATGIPFCFVVPGPRVVLTAGGADLTVIELPSPAGVAALPGARACEGSAVLCANGLDDDGNGLVDCADPGCQPYCSDAGVDAGP